MRATSLMLLLAGLLASCQEADQLDSTNPVHCLTIFGLTAAGAAAQSNAALVNDMNARQLRLVQANGGMAWLQQVAPESQRLAADLEAAQDEVSLRRLFDGCVARYPPAG